MLKLCSIVLSAMLCLTSLPAAAAEQEAIGYIKTVTGDAMVVEAGKASQAKPGTPLQVGNILKTGSNGAMGVSFKDNTIMSLGPDTEITVNEYLYSPSQGDLKLGASLTKGTLQYISGIIAKLKPEGVSIKTPAAIIGVRGTRFAVKVTGSYE